MKVRRQDLSVLALHCLGYDSLRNWLLRLRGQPVTRVLAFHDIQAEEGSNFSAKLKWLKERTNVISLKSYYRGLVSHEKVNVVITFDDGYKSWITTAVPILKELALPATFFVSSGFIGLNGAAEAQFVRDKLRTSARVTGALNAKEVKTIADEGFDIGGHTVSHVNLQEMNDFEQTKREIEKDKHELESMIAKRIQHFAYPFGAQSNGGLDLVQLVRKAGYTGAVTTIPGFNTGVTDRYLLKRDLTGVPMPIRVFAARVYGNSDGVRFLRRTASRLFGKAQSYAS